MLIWFNTLKGGQVGIHKDNLKLVQWGPSLAFVPALASKQIFVIPVPTNEDAINASRGQ